MAAEGASLMTTPRLYFTSTTHHGRVYSLALVVTHWVDEGTCLLERLSVNLRASDVDERGIWSVRSGDEGPSVLHVELSNPSHQDDEIPDWAGLLDALCAGLVEQGAAEVFYRHGDR